VVKFTPLNKRSKILESSERHSPVPENMASGGTSPAITPEMLKQLLSCHQEDVRQFVHRSIGNPHDSADVFQQTLLLAYRRRENFHGDNFRAWLFTIARHLIVDHHRAQRRFTFVDIAKTGLWSTEPALSVPSETTHNALENRDRLRSCLKCVTRRLPINGQVAVMLTDFYGFTDKESAQTVRLSLPSFKKLLHRTRLQLRAASRDDCGLVRSGDCPLLRPCQLNDATKSHTQISRVQIRKSAVQGSTSPGNYSSGTAALLALRRELLQGLGQEHDRGHTDMPGA
jgi:RNA polymerase sigma factor (sigma-70 family)